MKTIILCVKIPLIFLSKWVFIYYFIHAEISVAAHFSNIASRTWENLRYLSSGPTVAPLLPHKNFIWNSVRKASASNSSHLQPSKAISAFLRKRGRFSVNFRDASRWAQTIERPQSEAECSQGERIAAAKPDGATVPVNFYLSFKKNAKCLHFIFIHYFYSKFTFTKITVLVNKKLFKKS